MKITEKQIKDYHAQAEGYIKLEIEKDYPEVFKVDLWDKWLVNDTEPVWMAFYNKEKNYFTGLNSIGVWFEKVRVSDPNKNELNKPATQEQILEMLSKEAVKRGFKEGNHKCLNNKNTLVGVVTGFNYCERTNSLLFNWNVIFKDGTWAAIIDPVYEWQYVYRSHSDSYQVSMGFYTDKKDFNAQANSRLLAISKIKETKRLRK